MDEALTQSLDLMRRAQEGDAAALNRLIARYYERVRAVVRARLNRTLRQRVDSIDILQQVFAKVVLIYDRFKVADEASLIGWLAKIAERQVHDEIDRHNAEKRRIDREVSLSGQDGESAGIDVPDERTAPPDLVLQYAEEQEQLTESLSELPETYRELILARDFIGMSWEQVAEHTGRPSAAAARMMYAQAVVELVRKMKPRP